MTVKHKHIYILLKSSGFLALLIWSLPSVATGGYGLNYGNRGHGFGISHHGVHASVGNLRIHYRSPYSYKRHHRYKHRSHRRYSYPRSYSYRHYPESRSYYSPRSRYYHHKYKRGYRDRINRRSHRKHYYPTNYSNYSQGYGQHYFAGSGWDDLSSGRTNRALRKFGDDAQSYPNSGLPKLGIALSSAAAGNDRDGVYAMRRAFRLDPDTMRHYRLDGSMQGLVNNLIGQYEYDLRQGGRRQDQAFMLASLHYLNGDYGNAGRALERAERDGDRSRSLRNLKEFVRRPY